jgi:N utilization substance protein B
MTASTSKPRRSREEDGARRHAREAALHVLYGLDSSNALSESAVERAVNAYWSHLEGPVDGRTYGDVIVTEVVRHLSTIDDALRTANPSWRIERIARVERNILRIAAYEIMLNKEVPFEVAIDEAIELAREYGGEDSTAFVNGTLDQLARAQGRI